MELIILKQILNDIEDIIFILKNHESDLCEIRMDLLNNDVEKIHEVRNNFIDYLKL